MLVTKRKIPSYRRTTCISMDDVSLTEMQLNTKREILSRKRIGTRWTDAEGILPRWEKRAKMIASIIPPKSTLIDIGSGNQILKEYLGQDISYTPADIVRRNEEVLMLDINKKLWPVGNWDCAVVSGVLEYVFDLRDFFSRLRRISESGVISYSFSREDSCEASRVRLQMGWVSDFHLTTFINEAERSGLRMESMKTIDKHRAYVQNLMRFTSE